MDMIQTLISGPNAHTERAASTSQSYLLCRKVACVCVLCVCVCAYSHFHTSHSSPRTHAPTCRFRSQVMQISPSSMSSASPFSRGSAMSVSLLRLFAVSAKHLSDEVSSTCVRACVVCACVRARARACVCTCCKYYIYIYTYIYTHMGIDRYRLAEAH